MKIAPHAQLAVGVVEVIGAEVEVEVEAGHDLIRDLQDLHHDQDLVQEAHTGVEIEVEEFWIYARKDGRQGVEVDPLVLEEGNIKYSLNVMAINFAKQNILEKTDIR